jgi:hypothetical protein
MSKQSEARAAQNWRKEPDTCARCAHFRFDVETYPDYWDKNKTWTRDKNLRCGIGGFKTGKSNLCDRFEHRQLESGA